MEASKAKSRDWQVIHSSDNHKWRTPPEVFEPLNAEFKFVLDAAADVDNAKCVKHISEAMDSLGPKSWHEYIDSDAVLPSIWLNPPYGRGVDKWMKRAYEEAQKGAIVVCLVFASTDTRWWAAWVWKANEIRFMSGRVKFLDHEGNRQAAAPKGSAIVVFKPDHLRPAPNPWVTLIPAAK